MPAVNYVSLSIMIFKQILEPQSEEALTTMEKPCQFNLNSFLNENTKPAR